MTRRRLIPVLAIAMAAALGASCGTAVSTPSPSVSGSPSPAKAQTHLKGQFNFVVQGHSGQIGATFTGDLDGNLQPGAQVQQPCRYVASKGSYQSGQFRLPAVKVTDGETYGLRVDVVVLSYAGPGTYGPEHFTSAATIVVTDQKVRDVEAEFRPPVSQFTLRIAADGSGQLTVSGHNAMVQSQSASGSLEWSCADVR